MTTTLAIIGACLWLLPPLARKVYWRLWRARFGREWRPLPWPMWGMDLASLRVHERLLRRGRTRDVEAHVMQYRWIARHPWDPWLWVRAWCRLKCDLVRWANSRRWWCEWTGHREGRFEDLLDPWLESPARRCKCGQRRWGSHATWRQQRGGRGRAWKARAI